MPEVLISPMASLPGLVRGKWSTTSQRKKLAALEAERNNYRQKAVTAEKDVKELEEQVASLSAELEKYQPGAPSNDAP